MIAGLTSAEVAERVGRGEVNHTPRSDWADYAGIVARNVFTLFNLMVSPAAVALFYLGEWQAAVAVGGMATVNTALGLFQEIRAKLHLARLAILVQARVRVVRDGQVRPVPASEVVLGDAVLLEAGDAVVADGTLLEARFLEVDEALLTGESDPVRRQAGELVLSGSVCVAGEGAYRADRVGRGAFALGLSAEARRYRPAASPMTRVVNALITILTATAVALVALYFLFWFLGSFRTSDLVLMIAASITSMVPQGLVLMATLSFTLGALVMSRRGAVVQRVNAVETMAAIDVICTDKTGTLTTNRLRLHRLVRQAPDLSDDEVRRRLALFAAASVDRQSRTIQALQASLPQPAVQLLDQVPFKAQNRYSAVRIKDADVERILVLGAPEVVGGAAAAQELQEQGLRVLLLAEVPAEQVSAVSFSALASDPMTGLLPLALVALGDELRPHAADVLRALSAQGIAFKILSGDNPATVRATVAGLDLPLACEAVASGADLERAPDWATLVRDHSVFGRVAPRQKVRIIEALQRQGFRVAMIGDGVNDVLPIKQADLGIAMGEGSQAARSVAALVLESNDFALLPETLEEGRTIVRNLRRSAKLFLVKNVYSLILILTYASGLLPVPFPYRPQQVTLLNWLVIGLPALVIALTRERAAGAVQPGFLREVGWFALRTGITFGLAGVAVMVLGTYVCACDEKTERTLLLSVLVLLGITALLRVLRDGEDRPLAGDVRLRWLAAGAVPVYLLAMYWLPSADFFELSPLGPREWLQVLAVGGAAYALTLLSDRLGRRRHIASLGNSRGSLEGPQPQ